jgi:alpha-D-ribose 1-methylphosphonate 5-triphosphate synthase subunit PhnH
MTVTLSPGFADPVVDAQRCFRAVLDAMAHPGRLHRIHGPTPPEPLGRATAALLLTLADQDTPVWFDAAATSARRWIAFHCSAIGVDDPARAVFAVATEFPDLESLCAGTDEAPETASTLILEVAAFGTGRRWRLSGPGLREPTILAADGLPADFAARWQRNRARFPCGVDLVLCAGDTLTALPRSVMIEEG